MSAPPSVDEVLRVEAADWFARLHEPASGQPSELQVLRRDWQAWRQRSPAHQQAWQAVEAVWGQFEPLPAALAGSTLSLAAQRMQARRRALKRGAAGLLGVGGLAWLDWQELAAGLGLAGKPLQTARGEQRDLQLADGSRLFLNTASRVDARQAEAEGPLHLRLRLGELCWQAAGRQAREPALVLQSAGLRVQPRAGSRLAMRSLGGHEWLSVFAGEVELRLKSGEPYRLQAGQSLHLGATGQAEFGRALALHEAWTRGLLVAENMRLAELLGELMRYRSGWLDCAAELLDLRVVGSFPCLDPQAALQALLAILPLRLAQPLPGWTRLLPRD